ncbi:MAG: iron ABC transporter permease [Candidatus Cloacimonetes bacterium]|nr:iron ABC transporter permease [Candidatus Cloacimonadota bacterium]
MRQRDLIIFLVITILTVLVYLAYGQPGSHVLFSLRLPRLLLALLTGFVLAGVGYSFQIMLNNPLAEPYILGISSGAAFGSILAGVAGFYLLMPLLGFIGAMLTMSLVWALAHLGGYFNNTRLLLSGIIVGMFFSALISLIMYFNQQDIGNIINVLMGNLGHVFSHNEWYIFLVVFALSAFLMLVLFHYDRQLQIMASGDLAALSLGVEIRKLRFRIFLIASLLTGAIVAYAGIIGFIGLIVPHLTRMILRGNKRGGIVMAAWGGALLLVICDLLALHVAVVEIPVGIVTAWLGCPFFIYILAKTK